MESRLDNVKLGLSEDSASPDDGSSVAVMEKPQENEGESDSKWGEEDFVPFNLVFHRATMKALHAEEIQDGETLMLLYLENPYYIIGICGNSIETSMCKEVLSYLRSVDKELEVPNQEEVDEHFRQSDEEKRKAGGVEKSAPSGPAASSSSQAQTKSNESQFKPNGSSQPASPEPPVKKDEGGAKPKKEIVFPAWRYEDDEEYGLKEKTRDNLAAATPPIIDGPNLMSRFVRDASEISMLCKGGPAYERVVQWLLKADPDLEVPTKAELMKLKEERKKVLHNRKKAQAAAVSTSPSAPASSSAGMEDLGAILASLEDGSQKLQQGIAVLLEQGNGKLTEQEGEALTICRSLAAKIDWPTTLTVLRSAASMDLEALAVVILLGKCRAGLRM